MSRLDVEMDKRMSREKDATLLAIYGGLVSGVEHAGGDLIRISVSFDAVGCLLIIKAAFPAGVMVGFVGGEDMAQVLRKGAVDASRDLIKWRKDKWRDNVG